ncbi:MAG: HAD-IIIA family hydrolase [Chitinophagaceae bacterium]
MVDLKIENDWTLFLDRDGVINEELPEAYVNHLDEFIFYQQAVEAISILSPMFYKTIVVTNQKGVGRGLTPPDELTRIHKHMTNAVLEAGGKINHIYFCPDLENDSPNRKPNPGMAFQARQEDPNIDLPKSIMIGNNASDMHFGRNAGIGCNILLTTTKPLEAVDPILYDFHFTSLYEAALFLKETGSHMAFR